MKMTHTIGKSVGLHPEVMTEAHVGFADQAVDRGYNVGLCEPGKPFHYALRGKRIK